MKCAVFKQEQLTLCVRYAEIQEIKEWFLGFVDCSKKMDAKGLYGHIWQFVEQCGLYKLLHIVVMGLP